MPKRSRRKVGVLGAGAWGTALAKVLAERGHRVGLWALEPSVAQEINRNRANSRYLMGVSLPSGLEATTDIREAAAHKEYLVVAVPTP
ncbi:MAG: NAD(P)-binding domain-containing protein, partial [Spirochaetales bacterium]|nr:NAD(P)-binding domain-containing protein [Spirochaetales bacterium]